MAVADVEAAIAAEKRTATCTDGYPAIASFIARDPDHESFVFRRFNKLTARKLLHMQSELLELEQRLTDLDEEAANSNDHVLHGSMRRWEDFERNSQSREQERLRKELGETIELKLDRYRESRMYLTKDCKPSGLIYLQIMPFCCKVVSLVSSVRPRWCLLLTKKHCLVLMEMMPNSVARQATCSTITTTS